MRHPTLDGRAVAAEPQGEVPVTAPPPRRLRRRGAVVSAARPAGVARAGLLLAVAMLLFASGLLAPGCGKATGDGTREDPSRISVFASAVLTDAFTELGRTFAVTHPDVEVVFNFAGAGDLVAQVRQGAPADVLAVADPSFMDQASGLVEPPEVFTRNTLAIAVAPGNPLAIRSLSDLARSDVTVVLGSQETSVGRQSQQVLRRAQVTVRPASLEVTVKGVVTKVALGEADAGIVFSSDVVAADGAVDGVPVSARQNVVVGYPIAVLEGSHTPGNARAFVDLVLSRRGQGVLAKHGFLPLP